MSQQDQQPKPSPYERRLQFVQDWHATVYSRQASGDKHTEGVVAYASLALKSSFVLNGGGLLALPAFAEIFGKEEVIREGLYFGGSAFVMGLILVAIATLGAYINLLNMRDKYYAESRKSGILLKNFYYPESEELDRIPIREQLESIDKTIKSHNNWLDNTFYPTIIIGILSYCAFVWGCWELLSVAKHG